MRIMKTKTDIADFIDEQNSTNQVVIYSKSYCPYCRATKQLFQRIPTAQLKVIELDREENGLAIQQVLLAKTGQRTVPNVFVNNKHVGGNDDTQQAFRDGTLEVLLKVKGNTTTSLTKQETDKQQEKLRTVIEKENKEHKVVIWSKSYCPHCNATKQLFARKAGTDVVVHEMNEIDNGDLLQKELERMTGQRTVPNVFVNGKHIGGNSNVQALDRDDELDKLLKKDSKSFWSKI